ncbi:uncharacterized protein isoform X2 [Leptinotarsa decemlineata]|uniref:uncharacterized protein isoform X2 n=1 Tax=Leptinotarsa decemlineata TaxID=7539 RepID=UPI003D3081B0
MEMKIDNIEEHLSNERIQHEHSDSKESYRNQNEIPNGYNPDEHPPVKMRNNHNTDKSETQRKRRSKNRLSNRRSTGFVSPELVEEALSMGSGFDSQSDTKSDDIQV